MVRQATQRSTNFANPKQKAKSEAVKKVLRVARQHRLNYDDFLYVCQQVRLKLKLKKPKRERRLPEILSIADLRRFFKTVQRCGNLQHELMLRLLLYTAVRVSELVNIKVSAVDADSCKIFIDNGKGAKDR